MHKLKILGLFALLLIIISFYSFGQILEINTTKAEVETVLQEEIQNSLSAHDEIRQQPEKQINSLLESPIFTRKKTEPHKASSKPALFSIFQEILFYWFTAPLEYKN